LLTIVGTGAFVSILLNITAISFVVSQSVTANIHLSSHTTSLFGVYIKTLGLSFSIVQVHISPFLTISAVIVSHTQALALLHSFQSTNTV
jgi:hypothetical protein